MKRFKRYITVVVALSLLFFGFVLMPHVVNPRPAQAASYSVGQAVWVEWHGTWYKAKVIGFGSGCTQIHYEGYNNSWDECVGPRRIKPR